MYMYNEMYYYLVKLTIRFKSPNLISIVEKTKCVIASEYSEDDLYI